MRRWLLPALGVGLLVAFAGRGRAADDVKAVLDKAIKAHGYDDKAEKLKAARIKTKGKLEVGGGLDVTQDIAYQLPDKLKDTLQLEIDGNKVTIVTVVNGEKGSI